MLLQAACLLTPVPALLLVVFAQDEEFARQLSGKKQYVPRNDTANYAFMLTLFMVRFLVAAAAVHVYTFFL